MVSGESLPILVYSSTCSSFGMSTVIVSMALSESREFSGEMEQDIGGELSMIDLDNAIM